ncbi:YncE family protein [Trinickia terrae]|uniref:YncE family protein n=1 Tax=Trinickia terrae TaxID=2571161 RepID=UPI00146C4D69|nr:YncE family protein [Trinickia terrae]
MPNFSSNTVSVIDQSSAKVVATVSVGNGPIAVAIAPDGLRAYVVNTSDNSVSSINTATQAVVATINVPNGAGDIVVSPDSSRVYVGGVNGTYYISAIDTSTNKVVASNSLATDISIALAITPNGKTIYSGGGNQIGVIDTATLTLTSTISPVASVSDVRVSPDGTRAYVSSYQDVQVIDTATNAQLADISLGAYTHGLAVSPDGTKVYVAKSNGVVNVIDTASSSVTGKIYVGNPDGLFGVDLSSDGARGYVGDTVVNQVYAFSTSSNTVTQTIPVGQFPAFLRTAHTVAPPHTLTFYLHGNDVPLVAGNYAATQTAPASGPVLYLGLLSSLSWSTDPVMTGTSQTGAAFTLTIPCTVGLALGLNYTLQETDASGGSPTTLATVSEPIAACVGGSHGVTFPVSTLPTFNGQRLKLTISNLLALGFNLQLGSSTYLRVTQFSGTP